MPDHDYDAASKHLIGLKTEIAGNPEAFFHNTENLRPQDLVVIGQMIQLYCYCDLQGRRILSAIRYATCGERRASNLKDSLVFKEVSKFAVHLPKEDNLRERLIAVADNIDLHRIHRDHFAHWAARKVANQEVLILYTKNSQETERHSGAPLDPDHIRYKLLPLLTLADEQEKLANYADFLAKAAAYLEKNLDDIKTLIAEKKELRRQEAIAAAKKAGAGKRSPAKT